MWPNPQFPAYFLFSDSAMKSNESWQECSCKIKSVVPLVVAFGSYEIWRSYQFAKMKNTTPKLSEFDHIATFMITEKTRPIVKTLI